MRLETWHICYFAIPVLVFIHLRSAPYTKVEESFNIQATHDFLTYGVTFTHPFERIKAFYDHITYPGAVPRTFIGALVLAGLSNPFVGLLDLKLPQEQLLVRGVLGLLTAAALIFYTAGVRRSYGNSAAAWLVALYASQFHINFYASRTLPNTFAFVLTTIAQRFTLPEPPTSNSLSPTKRYALALYLLTLTTTIFRSELALLLFGHCMHTLLPHLPPHTYAIQPLVRTIRRSLLPPILTAALLGCLLTVAIDSFMWGPRCHSPDSFIPSCLIWPELFAFLENVFPQDPSGGASAWGTLPWHWYITSALPRLCSNPLFFALPLAWFYLPQCAPLLYPATWYVGLYSILPHKETRFMFPIVPNLTAAMAVLASHVSNHAAAREEDNKRRRRWWAALKYLLVASTALSFILSHALLLPLSSLTYPGGRALGMVHADVRAVEQQQQQRSEAKRPGHGEGVHVHLTNLALQTGITRFLEHPSTPAWWPVSWVSEIGGEVTTVGETRWWYDKTANGTGVYARKDFWTRFDYVVVESVEVVSGFEGLEWEVVGEVLGLGRPVVVERRGGLEQRRGKRDGVVDLLSRLYGTGAFGKVVAGGYVVARDLMLGTKVTGGRWVDWVAEPALVVLRSTTSVANRNAGPGRDARVTLDS